MSSAYSHFWAYGIRYGLYFTVAWGAVYWQRWHKRRRETMAQSWPYVQGIIISGKVTPIPKTTRFHATLQYTFFVEEYRTGKYVHEFTREIDADDFVHQMKDKRVQIRYKDSNPDKSVLEQSVIEQHILLTPRLG